jgi:hypothetical protein
MTGRSSTRSNFALNSIVVLHSELDEDEVLEEKDDLGILHHTLQKRKKFLMAVGTFVVMATLAAVTVALGAVGSNDEASLSAVVRLFKFDVMRYIFCVLMMMSIL